MLTDPKAVEIISKARQVGVAQPARVLMRCKPSATDTRFRWRRA